MIYRLPVFVFDHAQSAIDMWQAFVARASRQLIYPYLLLHSAILSHGVDLVLRLRLLVVRNSTELFLLPSLVNRIEVLIARPIARLARIDVARVALLKVASTHLDLRLLRWVRIGLPYGHVNLFIVFLVTTSAKLVLGQATSRRRFQVTVIHVSAVQAAFRSRPVRLLIGCHLIV